MSAVFDRDALVGGISADARYHEFLRVPAMSAGLYLLPAGATDLQTPHQEDEIYYVVRGQAKVRIGDEETAVSEGAVVFVDAHKAHRFFDIEQDLVLLVVFAPAETP